MALIELSDLWKTGTLGTSGTSEPEKLPRTRAHEEALAPADVPEVPVVPAAPPMPPVPPAAPCHPWAEHIPPLPVDDTDPYWLWLSGMTTIASASVVVKCRDCRHCDPNSHSPGFGWSTCVILHHGGWPAKPRTCQHFEPKDGVTEAMRVVIRMLEESVGTLSTTPTGEAA